MGMGTRAAVAKIQNPLKTLKKSKKGGFKGRVGVV